MAERGFTVSHTTTLRRVIHYVPEFEKRWNRRARPTHSSWRVDETYVQIRGNWHSTFCSGRIAGLTTRNPSFARHLGRGYRAGHGPSPSTETAPASLHFG
jgi:hypothetical protein